MKLYLLKNKEILTKTNFNELMEIILGKKDQDFTENIFYLFDENKDNIIDFKEMIIGLEIFRNDSYYTKMASKNYLIFSFCGIVWWEQRWKDRRGGIFSNFKNVPILQKRFKINAYIK